MSLGLGLVSSPNVTPGSSMPGSPRTPEDVGVHRFPSLGEAMPVPTCSKSMTLPAHESRSVPITRSQSESSNEAALRTRSACEAVPSPLSVRTLSFDVPQPTPMPSARPTASPESTRAIHRLPEHLTGYTERLSLRPCCYPRDLEVWRSVNRRAAILKTRRSPLGPLTIDRHLVDRRLLA
uniref:Uncharacterized protein n=1 Tax=Strombidinopsis acuminata TaxID=141414 RepID=A0A7S3S1B4_9SPIT|mmetsp:Transcript_29402/g.80172  ORF Transcript_29402/g.80172 Transcript_29402/m.80172 type:complete len:180 (-) Transcript_29402:702-1241(-)